MLGHVKNRGRKRPGMTIGETGKAVLIGKSNDLAVPSGGLNGSLHRLFLSWFHDGLLGSN